MKSFRVAVIGTGFIGPVHVEALRRAGQEVAAVIGSTPEKSRTAAQQLGIVSHLPTSEKALHDNSIESVHLTTPNRLHYQQAMAVLESGKHVLCEKPLAMNSVQSSALVSIAEKSRRVAGVAYNIRFYPLCHEVEHRIQSGELGELFHVTGSYVQDWLLYDTDFNWRVQATDGGELRAVADIGTHWLDLIQFMTGQKVVSVCADLRTIHEKRQQPLGSVETFSGKLEQAPPESQPVDITTEDCGTVMLRFSNGANGCLWVSQTTAGRKNRLHFEIAGSKTAFQWNSEQPNQLWVGHRDSANETLLRDPALLSAQASGVSSYPGGHNEGFPDTFKQLFRAFYEYVDAGDNTAAPPFPTFADGHQEILLCEAILRSHRERRWVDVAS